MKPSVLRDARITQSTAAFSKRQRALCSRYIAACTPTISPSYTHAANAWGTDFPLSLSVGAFCLLSSIICAVSLGFAE